MVKRRRAPRNLKPSAAHASFDHGLSIGERDALFKLLVGDEVREHDGIVCSGAWADEAVDAMDRGDIPRRRQFGAVYRSLYLSNVYPPRDEPPTGEEPRHHAAHMVTCPRCGRDCPPRVQQPVDLPGRSNGECVDCQEDRRAPAPPPPEVHYRRTKFARLELSDGSSPLAVYELADFAAAGKVLDREERKELKLREFESEERLLREITEHLEAEARAERDGTPTAHDTPRFS